MIESYFQVQRISTVGVNNVPTDTDVVVCVFQGIVVPKFVRLEDGPNINAIDIDFEISAQEKIDVEINDILREMSTDLKYRVVKVFRYQGPCTKIWASTGEQS